MRRIVAALWLAWSLTVAAPPARAEPPPRVALVVEVSGGPIASRMRAELASAGFEVVDLRLTEDPPDRHALESAAREAGAAAALRVVPSPGGVEVWVADRVTGKIVLREIVVRDPHERTSETTVALGAVELLRASLLEVDAPHPPRGEVPPTPKLRSAAALPSAARSRLGAAFGPAVLLSPGGLTASAHGLVGLRWTSSQRFGLHVFALFPTVPSYVDGQEGSARVDVLLSGAGAQLELRRDDVRWTPGIGAGLSVAWLHMDGTARTPLVGVTDDVVVAAPYVRAGLGFALARYARIRGDLLSGVAIPRPTIEFAQRQVAQWGRPFGVGSLSLEISAP